MSPNRSHRRRPQKKKSHRNLFLVAIFLIVVIGLIVSVVALNGGNGGGNETGTVKVQLETSMGDIVIELREETPITSGNFENLTRQGLYDGTLFHRVAEGFVIQGGQINSTIPTIESEVISGNNSNDKYTVAMALQGNPPDTDSATSQFFINLADNNDLDAYFTVFGRVIEGMDVVDAIGEVETVNESPVEPVTVISATVVE